MRVSIVEDNSTTRETLRVILGAEPSLTLLAAYSSAEEALADISRDLPQVLLVDLDLPGMHGTELISRIKAKFPDVGILVHTVFEDRENVFSAIKAGALGYILKGSSPRVLVESLETLHEGGAPMSPRIARKVIFEFQLQNGEPNPLTFKESEVVRFVAQGLSYKEIGAELLISPHTVHTHIKNIYEKLQVRDRRGALIQAKRFGII